MESTLILIVGTAVILATSYYILITVFGLLKKLVDDSRGTLKGIFLIMGVIALVWIISNREHSEAILTHVKHWASDVEHVDLFDLKLQ